MVNYQHIDGNLRKYVTNRLSGSSLAGAAAFAPAAALAAHGALRVNSAVTAPWSAATALTADARMAREKRGLRTNIAGVQPAASVRTKN
jgi:hypothetical protein